MSENEIKELIETFEDYVAHHGPCCIGDCPQDDTCNCPGKALNDRVNKVLSKEYGFSRNTPPKEETRMELDEDKLKMFLYFQRDDRARGKGVDFSTALQCGKLAKAICSKFALPAQREVKWPPNASKWSGVWETQDEINAADRMRNACIKSYEESICS